MLLVNQLRAIPGGSVVVQAAEKPDALRLLFSCIEYVDTHRPVLEIKPLLGTPVPRPGVKSEYQITWQATEDAASAFARFIRVLKDSGQAAVAGRLDLNRAIDELWRTLTEAARLKREGKLKGRLRELVDSDWAVTDVGIESLSHDFMLPGNQVPAGYGLPGTKERLANWKPERPTWVTDEQWERLIQRAKEIFPKVAFTRLSPLNENRKVWTPWVDPAL